jgi:hypothetical protein
MAMPSAPAAACQASSITEPRQAALASPLALVAPQDWAAAARLRHPGVTLALRQAAGGTAFAEGGAGAATAPVTQALAAQPRFEPSTAQRIRAQALPPVAMPSR